MFVFKMGVLLPVCLLERMFPGRGGTDDREEKGQLQECGSWDPGHKGKGWIEVGDRRGGLKHCTKDRQSRWIPV